MGVADSMTSWMSVTTVLVVGILSLVAYMIRQAQTGFKVFEKLGIPGPKPSLFLGNFGYMMKKGLGTSFAEWENKYGAVYGMYMVQKPALVVSDLDLLREIMVKKFSSFANRTKSMEGRPWEDTLLHSRDDHWKQMRRTLSPTFSSGKIKKMIPAIQKVIQNLDNHLKAKAEAGEEVELKYLVSRFTMDAIAGAAFGMDVNSINNPEEPFNVNGLAIQNQRVWVLGLSLFLPRLYSFLRPYLDLEFLPPAPTKYFMDVMDLAIKERKLDNKGYSDFLQLMVDAQRKGGADSGPVDAEIDFTEQLTTATEWNRKTLTEDEMKSNGFVFLLAGYDTTSNALSFTLFALAANPEVMRKAQEEVDAKLGKNLVTYDTANQLTYLDMCINETLRMFSPAIAVDRDVSNDVTIGDLEVKKGMQIFIPIHVIHRDPEHWPDPDKFDPERHTPEAKAARHPFAFLPFGTGPRNCIGMRFALVEIRMVIGSILQKYDLVLCDKSVYPPVLAVPDLLLSAKDGLWVKFKLRD